MKVVILTADGKADAETEAVSVSEKSIWNGKADQITTYTKTEIDTKIGDIETLLEAI